MAWFFWKDNAFTLMRDALANLDIEEIWRARKR
ncbi:hypothetical protein PS662_05664 [Pseudomonas fluorescens]|uniref:Uncharacterized protein n=1 Tax=Pseudomonas fluorescens TaxID=294 RepID=A0A5E6T9N2_PSEFL|nr:hypothetical protein PS645_02450 [Pseudomonas fluorescens]VVN43865.1 hypothetical protein PS662_05664 [Pseudomonas fluorescens]